MLPTLDGGTTYETCEKCGMHAPRCTEGTGICPNCGWMVLETERRNTNYEIRTEREVRYSDLLRVVPGKTYDVDEIVVATPSETVGPVVKRIIGLPGDRLEFRSGALFRNGTRFVRPLDRWNAMRIGVYNDDFRPDGVSRWVLEKTEKRYTVRRPVLDFPPQTRGNELKDVMDAAADFGSQNAANSDFRTFRPMEDGWCLNSEKPTFLKYAHKNGRLALAADGSVECRFVPSPITNIRAENGTQNRSDSIEVIHELLCSFVLSQSVDPAAPPSSPLPIRLAVLLPTEFGEHFFALISSNLNVSETCTEIENSLRAGEIAPLTEGRFDVTIHTIPSFSRFSPEIEVSTLDGIPRVRFGNQTLEALCVFSGSNLVSMEVSRFTFEVPAVSSEVSAVEPSESEFQYFSTARIGSWGRNSLEIHHLSLYRGEYWEDFSNNFHYFAQNKKKNLAIDCKRGYYLIGDNLSVSEDSRKWGAIPPEKIHGAVVPSD